MNTASFSRRRFLTRSSQLLGSGLLAGHAGASEKSLPRSETLVQQLYGSLKEEQKKLLCFSWDDPRRLKVDNNWHVTPNAIRIS